MHASYHLATVAFAGSELFLLETASGPLLLAGEVDYDPHKWNAKRVPHAEW